MYAFYRVMSRVSNKVIFNLQPVPITFLSFQCNINDTDRLIFTLSEYTEAVKKFPLLSKPLKCWPSWNYSKATLDTLFQKYNTIWQKQIVIGTNQYDMFLWLMMSDLLLLAPNFSPPFGSYFQGQLFHLLLFFQFLPTSFVSL